MIPEDIIREKAVNLMRKLQEAGVRNLSRPVCRRTSEDELCIFLDFDYPFAAPADPFTAAWQAVTAGYACLSLDADGGTRSLRLKSARDDRGATATFNPMRGSWMFAVMLDGVQQGIHRIDGWSPVQHVLDLLGILEASHRNGERDADVLRACCAGVHADKNCVPEIPASPDAAMPAPAAAFV